MAIYEQLSLLTKVDNNQQNYRTAISQADYPQIPYNGYYCL